MTSLEAHLAAWADLSSFLLLIPTLLICGLDPRRQVWGRSPFQTLLIASTMSLNIIFSAARVIAEAITMQIAHREFLLVSVIYSARWLWLFISLSKPGTPPAKAFNVARALRHLKTVRLGKSTKEGRKGEKELVIRRGEREVNGPLYWRGVEESVQYIEDRETHLVRLIEKQLHSNQLSEIGSVNFTQTLENDGVDSLYKKFYDIVMTADLMKPHLVVDYTPFLKAFGQVPADTRQPQRVGATDQSDLGHVARRIAADACYYIWHPHKDCRTTRHVEVLNHCLEDAAMAHLGTDSADSDV